MSTWLEVHKFVRGKPIEMKHEYALGRSPVDDPPLRQFVVHPDGTLEDVTENPPMGDDGDRWIISKVSEDPFQTKPATPQLEKNPEAPPVAGIAGGENEEAEDEGEQEAEDDAEEQDGYEHLHQAVQKMLNSPAPSEADRLPESLPPLYGKEMADLEHMGPREAYRLLAKVEAHTELEEMRVRAQRQATRLENLLQARAASRCVHRKSGGTSCGSPAMHDNVLCYFHYHSRMRQYRGQPGGRRLELPVLEDNRSLQIAITRICECLADNNLDVRTARALFCGIRMAQKTFVEEAE